MAVIGSDKNALVVVVIKPNNDDKRTLRVEDFGEEVMPSGCSRWW
jgi:hypothetical protein